MNKNTHTYKAATNVKPREESHTKWNTMAKCSFCSVLTTKWQLAVEMLRKIAYVHHFSEIPISREEEGKTND